MDKYERRRLRLIELRDTRCNGKAANLAKVIARDASYVSRMLYPEGKAGKKRIADDMMEVIEAAFGLPRGWLDKPLFLDQEDDGSPNQGDIDAQKVEDEMRYGKSPFDQNVEFAIPGRRVPIIDYVQAGAWREIADPFPPGMAYEYLISFAELSGNAFALRIKGDSMEPDFVEGDVIVVDPAVSPRPGSFVVAKNGGEEATFKKYRSRGIDPASGDDIFELVPLNDDYPTLRSDE